MREEVAALWGLQEPVNLSLATMSRSAFNSFISKLGLFLATFAARMKKEEFTSKRNTSPKKKSCLIRNCRSRNLPQLQKDSLGSYTLLLLLLLFRKGKSIKRRQDNHMRKFEEQ